MRGLSPFTSRHQRSYPWAPLTAEPRAGEGLFLPEDGAAAGRSRTLNVALTLANTSARKQHYFTSRHQISLDNPSVLGYSDFAVGSIKFGSIRFTVHSNDHYPRHVHGFMAATEIIVDLKQNRTVALADRKDAVRSADAKSSDVRKLLKEAAEHFDELVDLWRRIHG